MSTDTPVRVYSGQDSQAEFPASIEVKNALDGDAIAHDGVILIEAKAVDSSSNQAQFVKDSIYWLGCC